MTNPYNAGHGWRDAVEGALEFILEGLAIVLVPMVIVGGGLFVSWLLR